MLAFGLVLLLSARFSPSAEMQAQYRSYHSQDFHRMLRTMASDTLPEAINRWFATAGTCDGCHGSDPQGQALVTPGMEDVNPIDDWVSTMMANSARDPFWRAQVSHEVITNPMHQVALEDKCTSCHAPMGRYSHYWESGQPTYSIAQMTTDTFGLDGVSCLACHAQSTGSTIEFSGAINFDTTRQIYGQYPGPTTGPMAITIGFDVAYGPHIQESERCASCHTLVTQSVDLNGNFTGKSFFEQSTYHEWLNSSYPMMGSECRTCHIPEINENVIISSNYTGLSPRRPYGKHHFQGANVFMLRMMREYRDSLDIAADTVSFDSTISRTERMLRQQTLEMQLTEAYRTADTVAFDLELTNLAGHKFPSGYPSRRAIVEFVVRDRNGDTLFASGVTGADYEVIGQDAGYEPHYNTINDPGQAQIYEFIMGDANGNVTTTLERADTLLKDNRLVPLGFTTTHSVYDTTLMGGAVLSDPDFNLDGTVEGSGADVVHYRIPMAGYTDSLVITARVWYQTVRPGWLDEMFANTSTEIDRFKSWFQQSDRSNVLVGEIVRGQVVPVGLADMRPLEFTAFPNPTADGTLFLGLPADREVERIRVFDLQGRTLQTLRPGLQKLIPLQLPIAAGVYLIQIESGGQRAVKRVVVR